jgi:hypothetical protein
VRFLLLSDSGKKGACRKEREASGAVHEVPGMRISQDIDRFLTLNP